MRVSDVNGRNDYVNASGVRARYFTVQGVHVITTTTAPEWRPTRPSEVEAVDFSSKREVRDWLVKNGFEVAE